MGDVRATKGAGSMRRLVIIVVIVTAAGIVAFVLLGKPTPIVPVAATATPPAATAPARTGPATQGPITPTAPPITAAPTVPPAATPGGVANGRWEILEDTKLGSCEHTYKIRYSVFDSNLNGAVYAGAEAVYQVLDGKELTATVGPDGTWETTLTEKFTKTNSGCFSTLNPKVISVDGQPAF